MKKILSLSVYDNGKHFLEIRKKRKLKQYL